MNYWTTKIGNKIRISDMETSHIKNCINMIDKKAKEGIVVKHTYGIYPDYYYDEEEMIGQEVMIMFPQYNNLKMELKSRN